MVFQARKQNIQAIGKLTPEMILDKKDRLHLVQIFAPVLLILFLLLTPKDTVGCSWISVLLGAQIEMIGESCRPISLPWIIGLVQNAAGDAGAAGWWAVILLLALMFLDKEFRAKPGKFLTVFQTLGLKFQHYI